MDKFVLRNTCKRKRLHDGDDTESVNLEDATLKRSKNDQLSAGQLTWKEIRAEGLSCNYMLLYSKTDADEIFLQLEREIEYFSGDLSRIKVYGKWHNVPRKQVTYGDDGLTYKFSGITLSTKPWIPLLDSIRERVKHATGHIFNFVLINRYKDGNDHIGEHRDDERDLVPRSPIASVSFGACREFLFRHRDARCKNPKLQIEPQKLELAHGSLLMMNFPTNVYWYHSLPVRKKVLSPRINLTFRNIIPAAERINKDQP
uniref:DNA oxidative demethylase ALKBH2 n=1 Tax=Leptobrachium leishanense TaxID=445787 RepID=A0A8C5LUN2_9ANUR